MRALTLIPCLVAVYARFTDAQTSPTSSSSILASQSNGTSATASAPIVTPPPLESCGGCVLEALNPTTIAYYESNNIVNSTLITTAIITPHYWVYDDGSTFSTSFETVTVTAFVPTTTNTTDGTDATVLAEDLTWDYSGTALTYPTEYVIYSQFNVQPDCSADVTPLTITQTEITKVLFPVATGGAEIGSDVVKFLEDLPEFGAQFNGTNLQTCEQWVDDGEELLFPAPGPSTATQTASASTLPDPVSVSQAETELSTTSRLPIPFGPRTTPLQYPGSGNYTLTRQASGSGTAITNSTVEIGPPPPPTPSPVSSTAEIFISYGNSGAEAGTHTTVAVLTEATADARTTRVTRGSGGPPPAPPTNPSVTTPLPVETPPGNSVNPTTPNPQPSPQPSIQPHTPIQPPTEPSLQPPVRLVPPPSPDLSVTPNSKPSPPDTSENRGGIVSSLLNPSASPGGNQAITTPGGTPPGNNPASYNPSVNSPSNNSPSNNNNPSNNINPSNSIPGSNNPESNNPGNSNPQPRQSITIGAGLPIVITPAPSSQGSNQPGGIILGAGSTLLPGQSTNVNGVPVVLGPSGSNLIIGGSRTVAINPAPAATAPPVLNVGGATITANPSGQFVIAPGTTLQPGGPALTISGTTLSLGPSGSVVVVNGATQTLALGAAISQTLAVLTVGSQTITANPSGGFVVAPGTTLTPGGPALTISGTTLSLGSSGTIAIINGVTQTLGPAGAAITSGPALLTIGTNTYTLTSSGGVTGFVIAPGTTLLPGSSVVVSGTTYSLAAAATGAGGPSVVVINGRTSTLGTNPASNSAGPITAAPTLTIAGTTYPPTVSGGRTYYVIAPGTTLTPGGVVTVNGTRISLGPEGTVLIIGSVTSHASRPQSTIATTTGNGAGDIVASGTVFSGAAGAGLLGKGGGVERFVERVILGAIGMVIWVL